MGESTYRRERNIQAVDDLIAMTKSFSELSSGFDNKMIWLEKAGKYAELVFCPKHTKRIISQLYFERSARVVLTSATLTNTAKGSLEQKYSYFIQNTGFQIGG